MSPKNKKILLVLGSGVIALIMAVAIVSRIFDINSYRPRIEAAAFEATGLELKIRGEIVISFFPFGIAAGDIHILNKGSEIVSLESLKLGAELMPLLKKQILITSCVLIRPAITLAKEADGKYNFESTKKKRTKDRLKAAFNLRNIKLSEGALIYLDRKTGVKTEVKDFNLATDGLSVGNTSEDVIKNIDFKGSFDCKELRRKDLIIYNRKGPVKMAMGVIHLKPLTMAIFGTMAEGDVTADKSGASTIYKINLKVSKLDFEKLEESIGMKKVIGGKGDLSAALTIKVKPNRNMISSTDGTFSLRGDNLTIYTLDLDKLLTSYETSQKFNLVDIGAFFIAGPLSTVALKGYRYGDLYSKTRGGSGVITKFSSHWKLKSGIAEAADCALSTSHNRVALKGKLNLVDKRYENVTVALLDDKGCAKFKQDISGPFRRPSIGAVRAVGSLAGPIFNLFRQAGKIMMGGKCEVFYDGSVQQPSR